MYKIGYEQTDKKVLVDIYGIEFEVKELSKELQKEIEEIKNKEVEDFDELYKYIDLFLGEGASEKINNKRKEDGYDKMNYRTLIAVIDTVLQAYQNTYNEFMNYKKKFNSYGNRQYRRRRY